MGSFAANFWDEVRALKVKGLFNPHGHADRGNTLDQEFLGHIHVDPADASKISLIAKQKMVGKLHEGQAYTKKNLAERMLGVCEDQIAFGTARFCSCIDVSPDLGADGLLAFREAMKIKKKLAGRLKFEIGPNAIFGFKEGTERWNIYRAAAELADFLSALPEKDYYPEGADPDGKIGFDQHIRRVLELSIEMNKPAQFHLDQSGDPKEAGTERLIEALKWFDPHRKGPPIYAVHMISPSSYSEERFARLLYNLLKYRVGVIVCPSAGLSMRCLRPISVPMHNSIARVLELLASGVEVLLGSDNIGDMFAPASDGDMSLEVKFAAHATRFYLAHIWARVAAGVRLNDSDRDSVKEFLRQDAQVFRGIDPNWKPAVNIDIE